MDIKKIPLAINKKTNSIVLFITEQYQIDYLSKVSDRLLQEMNYMAKYVAKGYLDHIAGVSTLHWDALRSCTNNQFKRIGLTSHQKWFDNKGFVACNLVGGIVALAKKEDYKRIEHMDDIAYFNNKGNGIQFENDGILTKENMCGEVIIPNAWIYNLERLKNIIEHFNKNVVIKTSGINAIQNSLYIAAAIFCNKKAIVI